MCGPLEFHTAKADNGVASPLGFGCVDSGPGDGYSRYRGFVFTFFIILDPPAKFK